MERKDNLFMLLSQDGPFTIGDAPLGGPIFSPLTRSWLRSFDNGSVRTKFRTIRNHIFEILDVSSFAEIRGLLHDRERRQAVDRRAYRLLGNMFGIEGTEREIIATVKSYSRTADAVIRYLKGKVLANYASYIEMTNEIDAASSPVELLLILFDDRYHKKARFEAKRKLILMQLAGSIDQRERETENELKFGRFLEFLNDFVWSRQFRIGELEIVGLLSEHDPGSFRCRRVRTVGIDRIDSLVPKPGEKLTLIKRRRFHAGDREIPIYVSIRKKPPEAKVLKLLRKGEENPAVAVDDELGLMGVVESLAEVKLFQRHLTECAIRAGSFMTLEDISDTLAGGRHRGTNVGSSASTPMLKFFARMGGMRVEFIVHTHKSYLDYIYQREVSHDEYEVKRLFDSGVAELLFPHEIYRLNLQKIRDDLLRWFRARIEEYA